MQPKVSIIIPTQNRAHLLPRALESVLSQSFRDYEVIIINDGSTDSTEEVIQKYKNQDKRIRSLKYDTPQGIPIVRNRGLAEAKGKYIAWQDDDDEWLPGKLEKQVQKLDSLTDEYSVVYVGYWRVERDGHKRYFPPKWVNPTEGNMYKVFLKKNFLPLQAMIFRKEVFDRVGGLDGRYFVLGEYDWFPKISKIYKFAYIPEALVNLYYTPTSNSQSNILNAETRVMFVQDNLEDLKAYKFLAYHYSLIADLFMAGGKKIKSAQYLLKAVLAEPKRVILWLKMFLALVGINYIRVKNSLPFIHKKKTFSI